MSEPAGEKPSKPAAKALKRLPVAAPPEAAVKKPRTDDADDAEPIAKAALKPPAHTEVPALPKPPAPAEVPASPKPPSPEFDLVSELTELHYGAPGQCIEDDEAMAAILFAR